MSYEQILVNARNGVTTVTLNHDGTYVLEYHAHVPIGDPSGFGGVRHDPGQIHDATDEQQRHQSPTASQAEKAMAPAHPEAAERAAAPSGRRSDRLRGSATGC